MTVIDDLIARVQDVEGKLKGILSREKKIQEEEKEESEELKQIKNLTKQLRNGESRELLAEEKKDFDHAVQLFETIATELDETASDLQNIIGEIKGNASTELEIVGKLASGEMQVADREQIEEFTESLNHTGQNISYITREAKKAREEAQKAQKEIENLLEIEKFTEDVQDGDLSQEKQMLKDAKDKLQDAEWKLGEIPDQLEEARKTSQQTVETLEQNIDPERRKFIKGTAAIGAAAVIGLSGCTAKSEEEKKKAVRRAKKKAMEEFGEHSREKRDILVMKDRNMGLDSSFQILFDVEEPDKIEYLDVRLVWETVQGWIKSDRRGIEFDIAYNVVKIEHVGGVTSMDPVMKKTRRFESMLSLDQGEAHDLFDDLRRSNPNAKVLKGKHLRTNIVDIAKREVDIQFERPVKPAIDWHIDLNEAPDG